MVIQRNQISNQKQKKMETMTSMKIRRTERGCNYFEGNGAYQKEYDELWKIHVPLMGLASTLNGELIRAVGRLTHEYFNNGNCNARVEHYRTVTYYCSTCHGTGTLEDEDEEGNPIEVDCPDCGGCGYETDEEEDEATIKPMYAAFIRLIEENVPGIAATMEMVADVIYESSPMCDSLFNDVKVGYYSEMVDMVVAHVLVAPDAEIPEWYVKEIE